jgi:cell division protein FtsB
VRLAVPARRSILFGLIVLLVLLQYPLWFGGGGVYALWKLKREFAAQREENAGLRERNQVLAADVIDLKQGLAAIEERARSELGMIKQGETFYQVIEESRLISSSGDPK